MTLPPARKNNFDALRLFAACLIIYGHGMDLTGGVEPGLWGVPIGRIGLDLFFSISGYLVTTSWERDPRLLPFLARRCLRIFPGLAVCVLLTTFVLGPAVTRLPVSAYFAEPGTWAYLANIPLYAVQHLPWVFTDLRYNGAVNGSLWSLFPEFVCYLTIPLFARLRPGLRHAALVLTGLVSGGIGVMLFLAPADQQIVVYSVALHYLLVQVPFFLVGGVLGLLRNRPGLLGRADLCLLFLTMNYGISTWFGWWNLVVEWFTLPYMAISFGRLSLPVMNRAGSFGDLSFGLYLYAFPVQQLVLLLWPGSPAPILLCLLLTLPLAWLSWRLVERPCLALKPPTQSREPPAGWRPQDGRGRRLDGQPRPAG
jgi:peptidoglycan/LPS O-acetylase OafA/YrhL